MNRWKHRQPLAVLLAVCLLVASVFPLAALAEDVTENGNAATDNSTIAAEMMEAIAANYGATTDPWVIADMVAYGQGESLQNKETYVETAKQDAATAQNVIALTALGEDAAALEQAEGEPRDMVTELADGKLPYITTAAYVLQAYDSGDYTVPEDKPSSREALIAYFLEEQLESGSWGFGTTPDVDTTAMVLAALAPYASSDEAVKASVDNAVGWLESIQADNGNFPGSYGENANSTATVIVALSALGINVDTDERFVSEAGNSALDGLLQYRTVDNGFGYQDNTQTNAMATEQGFRALIAWTGMVRANGPYAVFDFSGNSSGGGAETVTVSLRIEGISENKLYTKDLAVQSEGNLTVLDVIEAAVPQEQRDIQNGDYEAYINGLYGEQAGMFNEDYDGWQFMVNGEAPSVGVGECPVKEGDSILLYYGGMGIMQPMEPEISYPKQGTAKLKFQTEQTTYPEPDYQPVTQTVPIVGATVTVGSGEQAQSAVTDETGSVELAISNGTYPLQIEKYGETEVDGKRLPLVVRLAEDAQVVIQNTAGSGGGGGGGGSSSSRISVSFTLIGDSQHGDPDSHEEFETWIAKKTVQIAKDATVKTLFEKVLKEEKIEYELEGGNYITIINGLGEKDNGPNSGWMYQLNGEHVQKAIDACKLQSGDDVIVHYTDDFTKEEDNGGSSSGGGGSSGGNGGTSGGGNGGTSGGNHSSSGNTPGSVIVQPEEEEVVFEDVSGWAEEYIYDLAQRGIVSGKEEGKFAPQDQTTRAELAAMLARMSGETLEAVTDTGFTDVPAGEWYASAVVWASKHNIVQGYEGKFEPDAYVSRQDIAVMIDRYAKNVAAHELPAQTETQQFADDAAIAAYAKEAVYRLQAAGILNGRDNQCFEPQAYATREEIAKIVSLFLNGMEA